MNIEPQYTFDNMGNPIGVFLPIDQWNQLAQELHLDIPQWQKDLIDARLAEYSQNKDRLLSWEEVSKKILGSGKI